MYRECENKKMHRVVQPEPQQEILKVVKELQPGTLEIGVHQGFILLTEGAGASSIWSNSRRDTHLRA